MADDYVLTPYRDDGFFSTPDNGGALPPAPPVESYPAMKPSTASKLWTLGEAPARAITDLVTLPGRAYRGEATPEEMQDWGPNMAASMIGGGTFGSELGAAGAAGGKLRPPELPMDPAVAAGKTGNPAAIQTIWVAGDPATANVGTASPGSSPNRVMQLYHRAQKPANLVLDGSETNADIAATLQNAWEKGHDAARLQNYTTPNGETGRTIFAIRNPANNSLAASRLIAYHGSPHDFDQFDLSKIGTGEGAQAYGHGLYFAENEGVAKSYRDALSSDLQNPVKWGDEKFTPTNEGFMDTQGGLANEYAPGANLAMKALTKYSSSLGQKQFIKQYARSDEEALAAMKLIRQRELQVVDPGHMYQVGINADPAHFLDWDAPMSQQHSKVLDAAKLHGMDIGQPVGGPLDELSQAMADHAGIKGFEPAKHEPTGQDFYRHLSDPGAVEASEALRRAGIPGVKYLDAGSRGAGSGSRNYVVFDDATISILKKYGLAGLGIGGAAAAAGTSKDARASPYVLTPWNGK